MRVQPLVALLPTILLSVTACGGSAPGSGPSAATTAQALSGKSPIVIGMTGADSGDRSNPAYADGLAAWVERANSKGGIDAHPVELRRCDDKSLADGEQQCSQQMVSDKSVLAVSGMSGFVGPMSVPAYEQAGLPLISVSMWTPPEYTTPIGIALNGGAVSQFGVLLQHFKDEGATSVSGLRADVASTVAVLDGMQTVAGDLGLTWEGTTAVSLTATDLLPNVTQALSKHPDLLVAYVQPTLVKAVLQAVATLGVDVPVLIPGGSITPDVLASPEARGRMYYTSDFSDPTRDAAHTEDYKYLESKFGDKLTDANVLGYILGEAFKQAIEASGGAEATRSSVLQFVKTGTFKDLPWMPSSISRSEAPPAYSAVANLGAYVVKLGENGKKSYVSDFVIPTKY